MKQQPTPGCAIHLETTWKVAGISTAQFSSSPTLPSMPGLPEPPAPALTPNQEYLLELAYTNI